MIALENTDAGRGSDGTYDCVRAGSREVEATGAIGISSSLSLSSLLLPSSSEESCFRTTLCCRTSACFLVSSCLRTSVAAFAAAPRCMNFKPSVLPDSIGAMTDSKSDAPDDGSVFCHKPDLHTGLCLFTDTGHAGRDRDPMSFHAKRCRRCA